MTEPCEPVVDDFRPERILVLAPLGRDAALAGSILREGKIDSASCADMPGLMQELGHGAGAVLLTQEAVVTSDLRPLAGWIARQPPWSDLTFMIITNQGGGPERNQAAARLIDVLGNVTLIERPFHPYTLVSVASTALRSRRRQYESRQQLETLASQQSELRDGEARFRALAENIPVLTWMANADGGIFWYNSRWYEYTGTTPAEMEGWGWQSVHDPQMLPLVMTNWQAALANGEPFEMVFPLRAADGSFHMFLTKVAPVRDQAGRITRWFGTNVDISAEKSAEAAIRASEESLRFALEAGYLGAWELSVPDHVLSSSSLCKAHFGRPPGDPFSYDDLIEAVHPDDRQARQETLENSLREDRDYTLEYRVRWPDRSLHWVEVRGRAVQTAGVTERMTGVTLDITARKNAEAELALHRAGLERLVGERTNALTLALDKLQTESKERRRTEEALRQSQKMEAVGQLTGGIAHDFNNLLTGISGSIELMETRLNQGRTYDLGRYIAAAKDSATRAAALTHRLLAFARRQTLERQTASLNDLAAGMEDLIRRTVGAAITVELLLAPDLWTTLCDINQLESALLNLCINAKDAMPEGGRLTIETCNTVFDESDAATQADLSAGPYVALSVTDTGMGMSPATVANAFDPFFTTKPLGQGTGLGLSMVYGFVKQSEGHAKIVSEPGYGTTISLFLPKHGTGEAAAAPAPARLSEPLPVHSGKTVLVVEDEAVIRDLIVDTLEDIGYRVLIAEDGPAGLSVIKAAGQIDLLLTDVGLPGMNGRQLADATRNLRPDLKILFMTGYAYNAVPDGEVWDVNMHIVTKPFELNVLTAKVQTLIEGPAL